MRWDETGMDESDLTDTPNSFKVSRQRKNSSPTLLVHVNDTVITLSLSQQRITSLSHNSSYSGWMISHWILLNDLSLVGLFFRPACYPVPSFQLCRVLKAFIFGQCRGTTQSKASKVGRVIGHHRHLYLIFLFRRWFFILLSLSLLLIHSTQAFSLETAFWVAA